MTGNEHLPERLRQQKTWAAVLVTALGVVITLLVFWKIHGDEIDKFHHRFEKEASSHVLLIGYRMENTLLVMESLKQLFHASELVEPHEFKTFTLPFLKKTWEISAIAWVHCLTGGQGDEAGKHGRAAISPGLQEGQGHGHPFVFIEPADSRFRELSGVDLGTLPGCLRAMEKTRKTGKTVLVRNLHRKDGTRFDLLLEPVYRMGNDEGAAPRDREVPIGFIVIVLEPEVILASFQKSIGPELLSITIKDVSAQNGRAKALASGSPPGAGPGTSLFQPAPPVFLQRVAFADRTMEFRLTPGHKYMSLYYPLVSWFVLPAGLIFSLMMGIYIHSVLSQRQVLEHLVEERTAELQKSEEKYRLLVENANEAIFVAQEGEFRFLNARTAELLGMDMEGLLSRPFIEHIHPEDRAMVMERHSKRLRGEDVPGTYSFRAVTGNQRIIWAEISSVLITWEGRPAALAFITDITERKSKEDALKERDAFFARLTSQVPGMLFQFARRPDGTYHMPFCNDGIRELFGCSPDDVRDSFEPLLRMVLPEDRERMARSIEESADSLLPWSCEFRVQIPGKPVRWVHGDSIPERMADGTVVWSGYDTDITERKLAEEDLRASEEKFALAFRNSPTMLSIVSLDQGRFIDVNESFLSLHGYSRDEVIGRTAFELDLTLDDSLREVILGDLRDHGIVDNREIRLRNKKGGVFWGLFTAAPITVAGETCLLTQFIDITERRELERQLTQVQKMESIGTLAGGIAHDFNNILSSVLGYAGLARMKCDSGEPMGDEIDQIMKAGIRARDLVKQILTFSRQTEMRKESVTVAPLLKETMKLLRASIPSTIELRQDIGSPDARVLADPTQIHQIIMNLCTNAAHAMKDRGGVLSLSLREESVDDEVLHQAQDLAEGPFLRLTVSDTGRGIPPEIIPRIFDPFFTTKDHGEGTGMGLSVVHGIVKEMGGTIQVSSVPGTGTTFHVLLPVDRSDAAEATSGHETIRKGSGRILLVDDEEGILDSGKGVLRQLGYDVTTCGSPERAIEIVRTRPDAFDLVITDMIMPGMTGIDLSMRIRETRPGMPILLSTGSDEDALKGKIGEAGITSLVKKPLIPGELAEIVYQALGGKGQKA